MDLAALIDSTSNTLGFEAWIVQVFVVVLATGIVNYAVSRVLRRLDRARALTRTHWDDSLIAAAPRPAGVLIWIVGVAFAIDIIRHHAEVELFDAVRPLRDVGVIACIAWFLVRFVLHAEDNIVQAKQGRDEVVDRTTVDAVGKLLRVAVIVTAVLVALQTLGYSVSGVLAFGGIGGLAVGFAAKDLLANFFGGAMIYMDRPFAVGDWVRSPDREIEGTVEAIGWRLTRIRTFDQRPLYVPNSVFTQVAVENPSRMLNRRIFETVGVRYDDAAAVKQIVADVETMLRQHSDIDTGRTLMVNFDKFAASSLDFFVYCFTKTTAWQEYHAVKQDVLLKILDIVAAHGAEVAFPTSTLHVPDRLAVDMNGAAPSC
jgi:MscS family membrane protein